MVPPCPREWWDGELTAPAKDPSQFAQLSTVRQAPELNQCTSQNGNMDFADSKNPNLRTQELADLASPGWGSQPYSGAKLCSVKWLVPSLGLGFAASPLVYAAMTVDEKM